MRTMLGKLLQIKNSFILVLVLIQVLILTLATLLTRLALGNIEQNEASKRQAVATFVTGAIEQGTSAVEPTVTTLVGNQKFMDFFAQGDREDLRAAAKPLFDTLAKQNDVKQMQFTGADFKVFLRVHNPAIFGDDVTTSRPTLVECIAGKHEVNGLEQGRSGYGFRAVTPGYAQGKFLGCVELGLDLSQPFLKRLDANYPGRWAIVNLAKGTSLTKDFSVLATLNEPQESPLLGTNYSTPENITHELTNARTYFEYLRTSQGSGLIHANPQL